MEEKLKIFFCEDDENLGMLLREYLQAKGYVTDLFSDGEAGYKGFTKGKYDLCVLDVMMPKKDGFTLAQEIRSINPDIPIIFLTAKTMKEDILEGFKIGADDYLTKPFSMEELLLRIEAILRRVKGKKMKDIPFYKLLCGKPAVASDVEQMAQILRNAPKARGTERIFTPGEIEWGKHKAAEENGLRLPPDVEVSLQELSADLGLELPLH